jgi:hypothetical protein
MPALTHHIEQLTTIATERMNRELFREGLPLDRTTWRLLNCSFEGPGVIRQPPLLRRESRERQNKRLHLRRHFQAHRRES